MRTRFCMSSKAEGGEEDGVRRADDFWRMEEKRWVGVLIRLKSGLEIAGRLVGWEEGVGSEEEEGRLDVDNVGLRQRLPTSAPVIFDCFGVQNGVWRGVGWKFGMKHSADAIHSTRTCTGERISLE